MEGREAAKTAEGCFDNREDDEYEEDADEELERKHSKTEADKEQQQ